MLLTETEARAICDKLLSDVKADDAVVNVNSENYGHLRFAGDAGGVEFGDVEMVSQKITGTGAVWSARSHSETYKTRAVVNEVAVLRR